MLGVTRIERQSADASVRRSSAGRVGRIPRRQIVAPVAGATSLGCYEPSMQRVVPRLVPAGSAPADALVEPLIANPPTSPLGEHALIPEVVWLVEDDDGKLAHVPSSQRAELPIMRGLAQLAMLDGTLTNEALEHLPGSNVASNGTYAAELLLDHDHLTALHQMFGGKAYLVGVPRRERLLVGGVGGGIEGLRSFVACVRREHDDALPALRISPIAMLVVEGAPTSVMGELQLATIAATTTR
jgi:hypothetical protein